MDAAGLLGELARRAELAPGPSGTGRYQYVHTSGVHLLVRHYLGRAGTSRVTGSVEPFERRQWVAADGSGRLLVTRRGEVVEPSGDYAPGRLPVVSLSGGDDDDDDVLGGPTTAGVLKAVRQVWNLQVVPPALRQRLLLRLTRCEGLEADSGSTAVTYVDQVRHHRIRLEFDEDTGALRCAEETALDGARVPVPVPAMVSRTTWLDAGYRETTATPSAEH